MFEIIICSMYAIAIYVRRNTIQDALFYDHH